jgi:hypothetical protein
VEQKRENVQAEFSIELDEECIEQETDSDTDPDDYYDEHESD